VAVMIRYLDLAREVVLSCYGRLIANLFEPRNWLHSRLSNHSKNYDINEYLFFLFFIAQFAHFPENIDAAIKSILWRTIKATFIS
jgi:hypothetical protein